MNELVNRLWGVGDLDAVFVHGAPKMVCPFPRAGGNKRKPSVRQSFTQELIDSPLWLSEVDPRELWSSQGWVLREHAEYYRTGQWELTGITSADRDRESNRFPVIMRDSLGRLVIAAGHHRAIAALIEGRPLLCRLFPSEPDEAIALLPHVLFGESTRLDHVVCTTANKAITQARRGRVVLCPVRRVAIQTAVSLSPGFDYRRLPFHAVERTDRGGPIATGWTWENRSIDVTGGFQLCTTCAGLKGVPCPIIDYREDHCRCEGWPENETSNQREARLPCKLCQICGLEVPKGHHRWRFVICNSCRPRAAALNKRVGYNVILQGIHSLVNQGPLYSPRPGDDARIVGFVDQLKGMFNAVSAFAAWSDQMLIERLRSLGFEEGRVIPLEEYLAACESAGIDREDGWLKLEAHLFAETFRGLEEVTE